MQGATEVALTVVDPLGYLDERPVCTGYEIDGHEVHSFPNTVGLEKAKPVLEKRYQRHQKNRGAAAGVYNIHR